MKRLHRSLGMGWLLVFAAAVFVAMPALAEADLARGVVFHDRNGNGVQDPGEPGVEGVRVSNGTDIVETDARGRYEIPVDDDSIIFVLKPRDWMVPVDENQLPQFYYIHKPEGSPELRYAGVAPTGPLPDSIDFPLHAAQEPHEFQMIAFGDTQTRNTKEVDFLARDIIQELIGTDAHFGVTLGDIVFDDLTVFEPLNEAVGRIGVPWVNVIGNHDLNFDVEDHTYATETFQRVYGPPYYAFDYGPVHFMVLDTINWHGDGYNSLLGENQLTFIENNLEAVNPDQLVVLMMHIPINSAEDRGRLFEMLEEYPNLLALAGHWHRAEQFFFDEEDGWTGDRPLHMIIPGMACGGWWTGHYDESGVPHTMMYDGAPNGYGIFTFSGNEYRFRYKAARRPADFQISLHAPGEIAADEAANAHVYANVFAGTERNVVEMRIDEGPWRAMEHYDGEDPNYARLKQAENTIRGAIEEAGVEMPEALGRSIPNPRSSPHLWRASLPGGLEPGGHLIEVRSTDMYNQVDNAHHVLRVTAE